jgi:hypothetical protein
MSWCSLYWFEGSIDDMIGIEFCDIFGVKSDGIKCKLLINAFWWLTSNSMGEDNDDK